MGEPDHDEHDSLAPPRPGSNCACHPERPAVVRCVMCDHDVCFSCFFPDVGRCQRCIELHPEEVADPIPFESRGMIRGFFPSVAMAFSPRKTAPSFAIGDSLVRPAIFFLLTFVPLTALRGIIPFTHRVHFGPLGELRVTPGSTSRMLWADVSRAAGISLVECSLALIAFAICYTSLARAFGRDEARTIGLRTVAYRAFLLPLGGVFGLLASLFAWVGPRSFGGVDALVAIGWLPLLPFYLAAHRSVRSVGRVDLFPGLCVVAVPWALSLLVDGFALKTLMPLLPPELRA